MFILCNIRTSDPKHMEDGEIWTFTWHSVIIKYTSEPKELFYCFNTVSIFQTNGIIFDFFFFLPKKKEILYALCGRHTECIMCNDFLVNAPNSVETHNTKIFTSNCIFVFCALDYFVCEHVHRMECKR